MHFDHDSFHKHNGIDKLLSQVLIYHEYYKHDTCVNIELRAKNVYQSSQEGGQLQQDAQHLEEVTATCSHKHTYVYRTYRNLCGMHICSQAIIRIFVLKK